METSNAFVDQKTQPTSAQVFQALGESGNLWRQLTDWLVTLHGIDELEWRSLSPKSGWSLRLKLKKRTIVSLGPCSGYFRASFVLGDKEVAVARHAALPPVVLSAIEEAHSFEEGTGVQLLVKQPSDLAAIQKLAEIKLAK